MSARDPSTLLYVLGERMLHFSRGFGVLDANTAASVLIVGLEQDVSVALDDGYYVQAPVVLVPAGRPITVDHNGKLVAYLYLDPLNRNYRQLKAQLPFHQHDLSFSNSRFCKWQRLLKRIYQNQLAADDVANKVQSLLSSGEPVAEIKPKHLPAIEECVSLINSSSEPVSNTDLSEVLGLSVRNLHRQFKAITGVTICRYRIWRRLLLAAQSIGYGASLTQASVEAGFFDSPHFVHAYHDVFGLKPSSVFKPKNSAKVLVSGNACASWEGTLTLHCG